MLHDFPMTEACPQPNEEMTEPTVTENSQWKRIQGLVAQDHTLTEDLMRIYKQHPLPMDIRDCCAEWIERKPWDYMCTDNEEERENYGKEALQKLVQLCIEAEDRGAASGDVVSNLNIKAAKEKLISDFRNEPGRLIKVIKNCMSSERQLISDSTSKKRRHENKEEAGARASDVLRDTEFMKDIKMLTQNLEDTGNLLCTFEKDQEDYILIFQQYQGDKQELEQKIRQNPNGRNLDDLKQQKNEMEQKHTEQTYRIYRQRVHVVQEMYKLFEQLSNVHKKMTVHLDTWQTKQKLSIAGVHKLGEEEVDSLHTVCEDIGKVIWEFLKQMDHCQNAQNKLNFAGTDESQEILPKLRILVDELLKTHVNRIVVIDKQPPAVLKIVRGRSHPDSGFPVTVRILGGPSLCIQSKPCKVTAIVVSEKDIPLEASKRNSICQLDNGRNVLMTYFPASGYMKADMNKLQLRQVAKVEKANKEEMVAEQKYAMIFSLQVFVGEKKYDIELVSTPMVLTSQTSQESDARGTVAWDCVFSQLNRTAYEVPDAVPWPSVAGLLNKLFQVNTGRGLNEEQLQYLGSRAFRGEQSQDYSQRNMTRDQLIKEKMYRKNFSFWKWFYASLNLIKLHLKPEWQKGQIHGFLSKDQAKRRLIDKPEGTFLLRISENDIDSTQSAHICGCITLAIVEKDALKRKKVYHVKDHLGVKSISEHKLPSLLAAFEVKDPNDPGRKKPLLTFLHPAIPFDTAFGKQLPDPARQDGDYHGAKFKIEIYLDPNNHSNTDTRRSATSMIGNTIPPSPAMSDVSLCSTSSQAMSPQHDDSYSSMGSPASGVTIYNPVNEAPVVSLPNITALLSTNQTTPSMPTTTDTSQIEALFASLAPEDNLPFDLNNMELQRMDSTVDGLLVSSNGDTTLPDNIVQFFADSPPSIQQLN